MTTREREAIIIAMRLYMDHAVNVIQSRKTTTLLGAPAGIFDLTVLYNSGYLYILRLWV